MMNLYIWQSANAFKWLKLVILTIILSTLNSCASVANPDAPVAENFPRSVQKELQASRHWQIVADDIAAQIKQSTQSRKMGEKPIYLNLQSNNTNFSIAFKDFLITSLVKQRVAVTKLKSASNVYDIKIQTIQYQSNRNTILPSQAEYTTLAAGLVVARNVGKILNFDGTLIGLGALADVWSANGAPTLEIIITTSLLDGNLYIARTSDIYYANNEDIHLYQNNGKLKKNNVFDDPFYQKN